MGAKVGRCTNRATMEHFWSAAAKSSEEPPNRTSNSTQVRIQYRRSKPIRAGNLTAMSQLSRARTYEKFPLPREHLPRKINRTAPAQIRLKWIRPRANARAIEIGARNEPLAPPHVGVPHDAAEPWEG